MLDEIVYALNWGIISLEEFLEVIKNKPENLEIILTGRHAPKKVIEIADLVTEMRKVKHYYEKGVKSRKGIER